MESEILVSTTRIQYDAVAELIEAAKDIRDNPGADAHGSVGFRAIELPKLDRLRDALAALDSSR